MVDLDKISFHLHRYGIVKTYKIWYHHGEQNIEKEQSTTACVKESNDGSDDARMEDLVNDAFEMHGGVVDSLMEDITQNEDDDGGGFKVNDQPQMDGGKKYKYLHVHAKQPLYPSCPKNLTTLYVVVKLNNIKAEFGWSDNSFTELLKLFQELLLEGNTMPVNYTYMKKMINDVGLTCETIHACVNDCILYRKEHEDKVECPICKMPRFKLNLSNNESSKVPQKVVRHFPLIPRLKRLYSIPWIAREMTWHLRAKSSSSVIRHPMDSSAWKSANRKWLDFATEGRNVRLAISIDGFNPHGTLSSTHSCWLVTVVPYNLPPSLCMKKRFAMMSILIPGPKAPSKDIDVYLEPLIDELKLLWFEGIITYDSFTKTNFTLKAMLMWGIHDFPAYGTLSGCVTHGYFACPVCGEETESERLESSKKLCYRGHRRFLPQSHRFRRDKRNFNGKVEDRLAPQRLSGVDIEQKVTNIKMKIGKGKFPVNRKCKRNDDGGNEVENTSSAWYRRSTLFDLPYWKEHMIRHCLDVMHIEKNVCDILLSTILDIKDKTKDGTNSRKDMETMRIKKKLWVREDESSSRSVIPKASFSLGKDEKQYFFHILKNLRLPNGFSSKLSNKVSLQPLELKGLKSHDYYAIMQVLLPLLLQHAYPKHEDLQRAIQQISLFFNVLCAKVIKRDDLLAAKKGLIEALCVMEKHFPPFFFTISIHLMVYLADEALMCGPVRYYWMYPFERLMKKYKEYAHNKRYIEGSIAQAYLVEESSIYCKEYLPNPTNGKRKSTAEDFLDENIECVDDGPLGEGKDFKLTQIQFVQVHKRVLDRYHQVYEWKRRYESYLEFGCSRKGSTLKDTIQFIPWLCEELLKANETNSTLWRLANGPMYKAQSYTKYRVNGFVFSTSAYDCRRVTQNSGVFMKAITKCRASWRDKNYKEAVLTYYGIIREIIELDYVSFKQVVFYCDWVKQDDGWKVDPNSYLVMVNLDKLESKTKMGDQPFILASEAIQAVFYSKDIKDDKWHVVLHTPKRLTKSVDEVEVPSVYQSILDDNENLKNLVRGL